MKQNASSARTYPPISIVENQHYPEQKAPVKYALYAKSNLLINSKGRSSQLGLKLFAVSISKIQQKNNGELSAMITGRELKDLLGTNSGSLYQRIKDLIQPKDETVPSILDWRIYINKDDAEYVEGINLITDCKFENGIFTANFNKKIKNEILGLSRDYTILNLLEVTKLSSAAAIKLYECCRSEMDLQRARTHSNGPYTIYYDLPELKQLLGIVNPKGINEKKRGKPSEDRTMHKRLDDLYPRFSDFKKRVLDTACADISKNTSIEIEYETIKGGTGGKVLGIEFVVSRKLTQKEVPKVSADDNEKAIIVLDTMELIDGLGVADAKAICKAADYDFAKIRGAYKLSLKQRHIDNFTGWMIAAVKDGYQELAPKRKSSGKASGNRFTKIIESDYDIESIEEEFIDN